VKVTWIGWRQHYERNGRQEAGVEGRKDEVDAPANDGYIGMRAHKNNATTAIGAAASEVMIDN
jgi:hypothetical protein